MRFCQAGRKLFIRSIIFPATAAEDVIYIDSGLFHHSISFFTGPRQSPNRARTSFTLSIRNVCLPCSMSLTKRRPTPARLASSTCERPFFFRLCLICSDSVILLYLIGYKDNEYILNYTKKGIKCIIDHALYPIGYNIKKA